MDEEEARLKALLEKTSDFDERKKIRAELRAVRMKKLDSLNNAVAAESSERAARRAERARARRAEQTNGDVSTTEAGVVITEQVLAEINDEETLQKLLNELPTSQYEDRRRIRTRIREVKRKRAEGEPTSRSTSSRQTREVTAKTEEPSGVTVETTVESHSIVTNNTGSEEEVNFSVTAEHSKDVKIEQSEEDISEKQSDAVTDQLEEVPANHFDEVPSKRKDEIEQNEVAVEEPSSGEQKYEEPEGNTEPERKQEPVHDMQEDEVEKDETRKVKEKEEDDEITEEKEIKEIVSEPAEQPEEKETDEINEYQNEGPTSSEKDDEICVEEEMDSKMVNAEVEEEESKNVSQPNFNETQANTNLIDGNNINLVQENESTDGKKSSPKDSLTHVKSAPKSTRNSRWPPSQEEKVKKLGQINTIDFRGNLKKSGRIGTGVVNLEKKNATTGAQVDFRGNLRQTGKSPINVKLPASTEHSPRRKSQDLKGKVDFGVSLKKRGAAVEGSNVQKDLPKNTIKYSKAPVDIPRKPTSKEEENEDLSRQEEQTEPEMTPENSAAGSDSKVLEKDPNEIEKDYQKTDVSEDLSNAQADDEECQEQREKTEEPKIESMSQKKVDTGSPTDNGVDDVTLQVKTTTLAAKQTTPAVHIDVSEHAEDQGNTHTEVREVNTSKVDGDTVKQTKEVTKVSKTSTPGGGQVTTQTKQMTTKTTRKGFVDPELQKRMAARQRERVAAKKQQATSAKNKRMAFMQKLEANSPASTGPTQIKRSASNVDKLLAWCRFKTRGYEGIKLNNFSSSWADGLAFCALLHLYLPDKIPYDELLAGGDKRRNFEVAFSVATEAGVPELLEVDDMLSIASPEPKSVMTYVSSIYKHFNPS